MFIPRGQKVPYEKNHRILSDGTIEKLCNRCDIWLPCTNEYFYENGNKIDGLFSFCKKCNIKATIKWEKDNPQKWLAHNFKMNRKPNKMEQRRIHSKKRRENGYFKEMYRDNPEQFKEYNQKYQQNKKHEISNSEWESCKKYFNYTCAYCGMSLAERTIGTDFHKEHYNHNGANDLSNCLPSCKICNSSKWEFEFNDWYNQNNLKFSKQRLDKINKWITEDYKLFKE